MPWRGFNPTLVRLRLPPDRGVPGPADQFQSHAGSIEALPHAARGAAGPQEFQSHAGSIEASAFGSGSRDHATFQSHAGSIEALDDERLARWRRLRFNPTLVRLRQAQGGLGPFQSHAGSIEAW